MRKSLGQDTKGAKKAAAATGGRRSVQKEKRKKEKYLKVWAAWPMGYKSSKNPPPPSVTLESTRAQRRLRNIAMERHGTCVNWRTDCQPVEKVVDLLPALSLCTQIWSVAALRPSAVAWLASIPIPTSIPISIPTSIRIRNPVATSAVKAWQCSITAALQNFK